MATSLRNNEQHTPACLRHYFCYSNKSVNKLSKLASVSLAWSPSFSLAPRETLMANLLTYSIVTHNSTVVGVEKDEVFTKTIFFFFFFKR